MMKKEMLVERRNAGEIKLDRSGGHCLSRRWVFGTRFSLWMAFPSALSQNSPIIATDENARKNAKESHLRITSARAYDIIATFYGGNAVFAGLEMRPLAETRSLLPESHPFQTS